MSRQNKQEIRKLRKKLRQIELLERQALDRELNDEESLKVSKKREIRAELKQLNEVLEQEERAEEISGDLTFSSIDDSVISGHDDGQSDEQDREDDIQMSTSAASPPSSKSVIEKSDIQPRITRSATKAQAAVVKKEVKEFSTTEDEDAEAVVITAKPSTVEDKVRTEKSRWKKVQRKWRATNFELNVLDGHNDLVCDVALGEDVLVTAGRDTAVKVWSISTGKELLSMGGHTGPVTAVVILPLEHSQEIVKASDEEECEGCVIASASHDCCIILWSLHTGHQIKSIYTYNPIKCLCYMPSSQLLLTGTNGGKIELWDLKTGDSVYSSVIHDSMVTGIKVEDDLVYTACADGDLKVFKYQNGSLSPQYESENMRGPTGSLLTCRPIHCLACHNNILYFGDDGLNVKALDWKKGVADKLCNHTHDFGGTDSINIHKDLLLSSGYHLDSGLGYVNVRHLPDQRYLCTLDDDDTSRVLCVTCGTDSGGHLVVVTGGAELKMWRMLADDSGAGGDRAGEVCQPRFVRVYDRPARDSDVESDDDLISSENDSDSESDVTEDRSAQLADDVTADTGAQVGWLSWCEIL